MLLVGVALLLPSLSGCALAARVFTAVEAVDAAHDLMKDSPDSGTISRAGGSTTRATVVGTGDSGLRLNGRPGGDRLAVLPDGTTATVRCYVTGPERDGPFGPTADWFQVLTPLGRGYMSGAYLDLDADLAAVPSCPASGQVS